MSTSPDANIYPDKYRGVSVTRVDGLLDLDSLRTHFIGRRAYFKTRYAVVHGRSGANTGQVSGTAIVRIHTEAPPTAPPATPPGQSEEGLFMPIMDVTMLASADDTVVVEDPEIDTGVPSELARAARDQAPGARAVVVHGRYEHVSFIINPEPTQILVREVVPPRPAKLVDQAARIIAVREDLPPIELIPDLVDLRDVAQAHPADHYLLPCRGSGFDTPDADVQFLDEHPPEGDWLMLGCTRSQQIHGEFYDRDAPQVSFCPRERPPADRLTLTKCCLQDDEIVSSDGVVSVPWGSSLERVGEALDVLIAQSPTSGVRRAAG